MKIEKETPHSKEAESYVLGSVLIQTSLASTVCNMLESKDFYDDNNKSVMQAIENVYRSKKEIDVTTVIEELKRLKNFTEQKEEEYILELLDSVPSVVNVEVYIEIIKEKAIERRLHDVMGSLSQDILNSKYDFKTLIEKTEKDIMEVINQRKTTDFVSVRKATSDAISLIEKASKREDNGLIGLDTGFPKLNEMTFGFQENELIILAARPAIGKSALALNFAANVCKKENKSVAFFSLEMGVDQLALRILSSESLVSVSKLRSGRLTSEDYDQISIAEASISQWKLFLDDSTTTDIGEIRAKCRKLKREAGVGLDMVIIDYLQLLSTDKKTRNEEVSKISRELKLLARELHIPVIALSQLSRDIEKRDSKTPVLSDLRDSGTIEQDADIVMFIHREQAKDIDDTTKKYRNARTDLIVAKNRQGATGTVPMLFKGDYSRYDPATKKDERE